MGISTAKTGIGACAALLAALFCISAALAQGSPPAPSQHSGTKLNFPPTVGGATFVGSADHGTAVSYRYMAGKIPITVQLFDGGRRVAQGSTNPGVVREFSAEVAEAEQQAVSAGLTRFEKPAAPSSCTYGTFSFRCIVYSATSGNNRVYGKLLLTGYHDYFLKIIVEWAQADGVTVVDADKALLSFVPALLQ